MPASSPSKYRVRRYMKFLKSLRESEAPIPTPDEVRRQLGWGTNPGAAKNRSR